MPVLVGGKPPKKPFKIKGKWIAIALVLLLQVVIAPIWWKWLLSDGASQVTGPSPTPSPSIAPSPTSQASNTSQRRRRGGIRLVPFSTAISYPKSRPKTEIEATNRERFIQVFQTDEIYLLYVCSYNKRGLLSYTSLVSVEPERLYTLINGEFENSTGSTFRSSLCEREKSATLQSVDISVSIIYEPY